jgi:predicted  nucleic acid-binding Zn-ribbon protein
MSEERWHEQANVRRLEASNEALEVKLDEAADRIEALEERMRGADALIVLWETRATRAEARVEQLEAEIDEAVLAEREACAVIAAKRPHHSGIEIAELIRDQSSPPHSHRSRTSERPHQR